MSFLFYNAAAITVALVASVTVWVFGGIRGDLLPAFVPWMFAFMAEIIVCFPQRHRDESTYAARDRVWRSMKRDPVFWVSLGLLVLLLVPLANSGLCPICDAQTIALGIDPAPAVPFLPHCVNRVHHLHVVMWFALALPALVAVRHSLTRRGKRLVLQLIVWNGVAVAALGFVQAALGAPGPLWTTSDDTSGPVTFFATFGYPNMGGDYFTALFGVAVALWRDRCEQMRRDRIGKDVSKNAGTDRTLFWRTHLFLIPAAIFFFSALNTLSRAAILLVTSTAVVYFAHTLVSSLHRMHRARRVVVSVWSLMVFGLIVFFSTLFMPESVRREVDTVETTEALDRVTGRGQYHVRVATELWRDNLLFGCGGWGYAHLCMTKMTPEELKQLQTVGGANVHNDYLQFLAEHGLAGFGALVALAVMLLWPVCKQWKRLVRDTRFMKGKDRPPRPAQIFALPAPVFVLLVSAAATLIHAFGDCPLRSPAVLMLLYIILSALPGFMPKSEER